MFMWFSGDLNFGSHDGKQVFLLLSHSPNSTPFKKNKGLLSSYWVHTVLGTVLLSSWFYTEGNLDYSKWVMQVFLKPHPVFCCEDYYVKEPPTTLLRAPSDK